MSDMRYVFEYVLLTSPRRQENKSAMALQNQRATMAIVCVTKPYHHLFGHLGNKTIAAAAGLELTTDTPPPELPAVYSNFTFSKNRL